MSQERLTATEARIAGLVAAGRTDPEIAAALALRPQALEHHLADLYRKLAVRSRTELALLFGEKGVREVESNTSTNSNKGGTN